ncbi:MAG: rod shape-determining protein RodA [Desulfomonilaceae bacterium]
METGVSPLYSSPATSVLYEWQLVGLCLMLSAIGVGLIYSATAPMGSLGKPFVIRQLTWISFGIVIAACLLFFDYKLFEHWGVWFYVFVLLMLVFVWSFGRATSGSRRWIDLGLMRLQPSEFAKLAIIVVLARYFHDKVGRGGLTFRDLTNPFLLTLLPVGLVLIQPDLGTAAVTVLVAISMVAFIGVEKRTLLWLVGSAVTLAPIAYFLGEHLLLDYQKKRILTFLNPEYDPVGAGYHIIQSQIAIGSGGLFGKGFLQGTQNQLMFLPVKHTDFVFAVLAEEWGFVGCLVVLLLFSGVLLRGLAISGKARDNFGALISFGCVAMIFWHVTINVGMVTGLLPVVGVPLSFLSYGGSSLLSSFLAISILVNVSMRRFVY